MGQVQSDVAAAAAIDDQARTQQSFSLASMDSLLAEAAAFGNDENQSLDAQAQKALECPCVAELRNGACGVQFTEAFLCFLKSTAEEKGSDCVHPFIALQNCIKVFLTLLLSRSRSGNRVAASLILCELTQTMSAFGSLSLAICPDYFGDEFGVPLSQSSMMKNQATELGNSGVTKALPDEKKNGSINGLQMAQTRESRRRAPALAPIFDGLHCFETIVFSN
ncbi:LOW QUALITY PROTEIN: uncharacterized protein LOC110417532 [Herrania umbratica]|uniref:Mitochondrial intermembrane space import and assembly protein 40 homolog n=1 Tax=Herrania umbratica TaxID=108875 RepID=A0A6J1AG31_9ROSI|nr:LOW QUALITY PROTEIN: uncharacterized protein LOC110417532 [Herrania umbratica]